MPVWRGSVLPTHPPGRWETGDTPRTPGLAGLFSEVIGWDRHSILGCLNMASESVADKSAAHDADGLAGFVLVGGLRADDEHLAQAALPLGDVAYLHRAGQDIARTDVVEVLVVGSAVEDALEVGLESERFGAARGRLARDHDWVAEEAGRSDDRAIASGLGGRFVEENGIGVTDSACELTATGVVNLVCDGFGFLADDGSHFVGDEGLFLLGHGRLLLGNPNVCVREHSAGGWGCQRGERQQS